MQLPILGSEPPAAKINPRPSGWAPFALGFRPFFLAAALAALVLVAVWLVMWIGRLPPVAYYGQLTWHSHEMLFGYAVAVIAGFLLTAVRNWTNLPTPDGAPLAGLTALWLAGRLVPLTYPTLPGILVALVDGLFLPALMAGLAGPLWRGANRTNRLFLPLLGAMAVANGLVHLQALGLAQTGALGTQLMLNLVVILVSFIGGRVMPFFTEKAIAGATPKASLPLEWAVFGSLIILTLVEPLAPSGWATALVAGLAAVAQALRLLGWYDRRVWQIPILWVLYLGYAWLVVGLALKTLGALGLFPPTLALHALTLGGFGLLTLGMMARVALGHTGRAMQPSRWMTLGFGALFLASLVRVFGPLLPGVPYLAMVHLSGTLWLIGFLAFLWLYAPILTRPRVDGRPG